MPRKPKVEKQLITVMVNGKPVKATLHPPSKSRTSWYVYWPGLVSSKSTGQRILEKAIGVVESMILNEGKCVVVADTILFDEEFKKLQRHHYTRKQDPIAQKRSAKSLQSCLEAIHAFQVISGIDPIVKATPDDCAAFQIKAINLPKNTLRPYPNGKEEPGCYSPNTVIKWSVALKAAWERACRNSGNKCVRGVVDDSKLLLENPWRQFRWIEGFEKPIRQFSNEELLSILKHLSSTYPTMSMAQTLAKVFLWSCARREAVCSLKWDQLRIVEEEYQFDIVDKHNVRRWFRIPEGVYNELQAIRGNSPFVFASYNDQLRQHYSASKYPHIAEQVGRDFSQVCLGDWFYEQVRAWNSDACIHVFRKTNLQFAYDGEQISQEVAKDAGVGAQVMMTHYVRKEEPALHRASNTTYRRILASLPPEVASVYGCTEINSNALQEKLAQAYAQKDWKLVARISSEIASQQREAS